MTSFPAPASSAQRGDVFVTTRWTVVLAAGRKSSPHSERALGELCQTYWYPLYAYVRRKGHGLPRRMRHLLRPDGGDTWTAIADHLPGVLSVEVQTLK